MIKPDWNIFKFKFTDNPQFHFEWLCYLLFCNEYGKKTGIFRYKNQSAIETDPIVDGDDILGWQAKFYGTALSDNKDDILKMLKKAKRDYPNITKIVFYTNSEWGQYKGKEPSGKKEIEKEANKLLITIEWRCGSYFESPFVVEENKKVCSHFFVESDNIFDLLLTLVSHTDRLLNKISENIDFYGKSVEIDRSSELSSINTSANRAAIISGEGGTGKTALIKSLYKNRDPHSAFYAFKATEFQSNKVEEILSGVSLDDFLTAHLGVDEKIVVIDSAEHLLSLENTDPFREFVTGLLENGWKVWLTTRNNYLNDLAFQFIEVYQCSYETISLTPLNLKELRELADKYNFDLPTDQKLIDLISVPMYLKEYLRHYTENKSLDYLGFKNSLWPRVILKSNPERERVFIDFCVHRVNSGRFFIPMGAPSSSKNVIDGLIVDGILGYESPHGYFVTHDLYEEWALDKRLEASFLGNATSSDFFDEIGKSLPVRRAFRKWLSEMLSQENEEILTFLNESLTSSSIEKIWLDETIVAILLSDHSGVFFNSYKDRLLSDDCSLLKKVCLLVRIGCKEVNTDIFEKIGIENIGILSMEYVLTRPRGDGWEALIRFIWDNKSKFLKHAINFVLPVLNDWNNNNRSGETTRMSSLLALEYYEIMLKNDTYYTRGDDFTKNLLHTIIFGSKEIKQELSSIIDLVVNNRWRNHNDPYSSLCGYILSKMECATVAQVIPEKVIDLAKLYWTHVPPEDEYYYSTSEIDHYFGIEHISQDYFPASAYQTPIYSLLGANLYKTLDFIIEFSNYAAEKYVNSSLSVNEYETVPVWINEGTMADQYMSNRLWCVYRGTQVNSDILESINMALEKFLIERGKNTPNETLEKILLSILSRSNSAILTSVVVSVVAALSDKTFNIAKVLFRTKELFLYDTNRYVLDRTHKSQLISLKNNFGINGNNELHENERIDACDDSHRKFSLEHIMLQYQLIRKEEISEKDFIERSEEIWRILDAYYEQLPDKDNESHYDKKWRLFLARMDRRKMSLEAKETEDGFYIDLNPEIDDELRQYSEDALEKTNEAYKNSRLMVWASDRLYGREGYKKYEDYENDPLIALKEVKTVWSDLTSGKESDSTLFNRSLPSDACTVLLRDFVEKLDSDGLKLCRDIIFSYASLFTKEGYMYQTYDGVLPAISVLPVLHNKFTEDRADIKALMILALMRNDPIGMMGGARFNSVPINALQTIWAEDYDSALAIYIGYLVLAKRHEALFEEFRRSEYENGNYNLNIGKFWKSFFDKTSYIFEEIADGSITDHIIDDLDSYDIDILSTAFQLVPLHSTCPKEVPYAKSLIEIVASNILSDDREHRIDYLTKHNFLGWYTKYVLHSDVNEISKNLAIFTTEFSASKGIVDLLEEFVRSEDRSGKSDNFWKVWDLFKDNIVSSALDRPSYHYSKKIIEAYMLASTPWKNDATIWPALTDDKQVFFENLTEKIGGNEAYLYSLSKLLCGIGSSYLNSGIFWLSNAIRNNNISLSRDYRENTMWYLEKATRKYVFLNRDKARKNVKVNAALLCIFDYLIENGSVLGYLFREDIT
ncbi:AVAST type 4 anti-phage nuclease Avs4 [Reinekea marinisedimentorum]|uniref:ATPase family protein associated with various cellular activities (AAA) n=1 Tax=Reinekea marinisedimentorum TaxID=230495 RepID=A0A4R3HU52_9GAMM|nr:AVAST type 4 anti-phage nuclease Avs4 [Reinekea marinisedimentorum]TCS35681.1 hypothetical protein BCF53_1322 [Reinekea marinisedimentorum]